MLFCLRKGQVDLTQKSIVFLHGFLGCSQDWMRYLDYFSSKGFSTLAIDLPGHGRSEISNCDPLSENSSASECDQLFKLIPRGAHVVGYSMGGRIALYLSSLRPHWFSSLTLISTNPGLQNEQEIRNRLISEEQWIKKLEKNSIETFINDWYKQPLFSNYKPHSIRYTQDSKNLTSAIRKFSIAKLPSMWDYLLNVRHPLQMVFGEHDQKFMKVKREIDQIDTEKQIQLLISQNTSHPVHLEAPDFLIDTIDIFVEKVIKND